MFSIAHKMLLLDHPSVLVKLSQTFCSEHCFFYPRSVVCALHVIIICLFQYLHYPCMICFQKLMIDEKRCYFFGRNKQLCDFSIEHGSCSRVHAALVWHKHLNRPFIVDLGSSKFSKLHQFCPIPNDLPSKKS